MEGQSEAAPLGPGPAGSTSFTFAWFMCAPWVPKFSGEKGTVKFREWRVQVQAMLRAQALIEEQQADFVLGALEGIARREMRLHGKWQQQNIGLLWKELEERWSEQEPGMEDEDDALLRDQFLLGLSDGPLIQELQ
ncbi:hypothetical protein SKAU_G00400280 [Synaphobranchus kaupii]|uniref:Uncharacterized protein n=1 Tax=Synaphobranchus kaupii TaxID=118154 RepID=A0A9Q1E8X0_SYNKA|nr:hypothetical protein SKAU_G00400280 [Synaphobranchus kaupii]